MLLRVVIGLVLALGCWQGTAQSQSQSPTAAEVADAARAYRAHKLSAILARMESSDRPGRQAAFEDLLNFLPTYGKQPAQADGQSSAFLSQNTDEAKLVRGALIRLLITENNRTRSITEHNRARSQTAVATKLTTEALESDVETEATEDEYYPELIGIVADFNDDRAIPALLGAASTGGMATVGVARYGKKALDQVLQQAAGQDPHLASGALWVIRDMVEFRLVNDPDSLLRMTSALRSALTRPDFELRDSALWIIGYLPDRDEFVPALNEIAEHDPITLPGKPDDGGDGRKFYPLRQNARKLLRMIANHEWTPVDQGLSSDQVSPR
jgi:hypothetical protein